MDKIIHLRDHYIMPEVALVIDLHKEEVVLAKALDRVVEYWRLTNKELGGIVGLSEASVSRMRHGKPLVKRNSKDWQLAVMVLRIFRSLDSYMGGDVENQRSWIRANNKALGGIPIEIMRDIEGISSVAQYLDYMRGQ